MRNINGIFGKLESTTESPPSLFRVTSEIKTTCANAMCHQFLHFAKVPPLEFSHNPANPELTQTLKLHSTDYNLLTYILIGRVYRNRRDLPTASRVHLKAWQASVMSQPSTSSTSFWRKVMISQSKTRVVSRLCAST